MRSTRSSTARAICRARSLRAKSWSSTVAASGRTIRRNFNWARNGLVPTTVGGNHRVLRPIAAPVLYTSANQVGVIVPFGISGSQVPVTVSYNGQFSSPLTASVATAVPAIFTLNYSGSGQAAAVKQER